MNLSEQYTAAMAFDEHAELRESYAHCQSPSVQKQTAHLSDHEVILWWAGHHCAFNAATKVEATRRAPVDEAVAKCIEALELYASCPPESGIPERIINGGEFIGLGTAARDALAALKESLEKL